MTALIESHYLPSLEFFCALVPFDEIILEVHENFPKQSFRNRCYINTSNGIKMLTVPLVERHGKILMKDVRIDLGKRWRNNHWRTIESAYRKAPFYEYYSEELKKILFQGHELLIDLNNDLLSFCLRNMKIKKNISVSMTYEKVLAPNQTDLRSVINDKKSFASRHFYQPQPYYQVFGNIFAPNLSLIDLLFCEGPQTTALIKASAIIANK